MSLVTFLYRKNEGMDADPSVAFLLSTLVRPTFVNYQETEIKSEESADFLWNSEFLPSAKFLLNFRLCRVGMIINCDSQCRKLFDIVEACRKSLPLDSKRPTVNRRFFHDINGQIVQMIEHIVLNALIGRRMENESNFGGTKYGIFEKCTNCAGDSTFFHVYCNRYVRILEYNVIGSGLAPHTDGSKICDITRYKSTHTLLLYLSDCEIGGETVIVDSTRVGWSKCSQIVVPKDHMYKTPDAFGDIYHRHAIDVSYGCTKTYACIGVSPQIGRIFLFPHEWPHAGALCRSIPKNVLRAEVTIQFNTTATLCCQHLS
jgi:hypothetical protein